MASSNFPTTIGVVGKTHYGDPLYKTIDSNSWLMNIAQEYVVFTFEYSTTSTGSLYSNPLLPKPTDVATNPPWFWWFMGFYMGFECEFDVLFEPIKHSAHRGAFSVSITVNDPTAEHIASGFLPLKIFDISGETSDLVYPVPNVYAYNAKMYPNDNRSITEIITGSRPYMSMSLGTIDINAVTPLAASAMLPDTITILVKLLPKIQTLRLVNPILPYDRAGSILSDFWSND